MHLTIAALQNQAVQCANELLAVAMLETSDIVRKAALEQIETLPSDLWPTADSRHIAQAIRSLLSDCREVDLVSVASEAKQLELPISATAISAISELPGERYIGGTGSRVAKMCEWAVWQKRELLADALKDPNVSLEDIRQIVADADFGSDVARNLTLFPTNILEAGRRPDPIFQGGPVRGTLAVLSGESGLGKSYEADLLAAQCITGITLQPSLSPLEKGAVLFFSYEDPPEIIRWRLERIGEVVPGLADEINAALEAQRLQFFCDLPGPLFAYSHLAVATTPVFTDVETIVRETSPGLVVIDPFSGAAALRDENSNAEVNIVAAPLFGLEVCRERCNTCLDFR